MKINPKTIAFCSVLISLGLITSAIKLFHLPFGGSITLFSMFFICLIGYLYGPYIGITSAVTYGILQSIFNPSFYSIYQFFFDYILAFASLGLSGFFREKKYSLQIGYSVSITFRFIFSTLSGYLFFAKYAPSNMHPIIYSSLYNGSYIFTEAIITLILISIPILNKLLVKIKKHS